MSLKTGLIGLGHLGKIHLRCLLQVKEIELIGIYDLDAALSAKLSAEFGVKAYESQEELINACDAIDIVSPTTTHFEIAIKALEAGKHLFVEKPVVNTPEEADILTALATQKGTIIQVGHVERFNPAYLALENVALNPLFIEAHRLAEFNPRGTDVPVVLDLMIHDLDIVLQLIKSEIKSISASGVCVVSDTPDISNVRIEFENGAVANITASRMALNKMRKMRVFQRDAYIAIDFLEKQAQIIRLESPSDNNECQGMELHTNEGKKCLIFDVPKIPQINAIEEELRSFAHAVLFDKPIAVPLSDAVRALKVAHQIVAQIEARNELVAEKWNF
jgi:predicted dehydrogenase